MTEPSKPVTQLLLRNDGGNPPLSCSLSGQSHKMTDSVELSVVVPVLTDQPESSVDSISCESICLAPTETTEQPSKSVRHESKMSRKRDPEIVDRKEWDRDSPERSPEYYAQMYLKEIGLTESEEESRQRTIFLNDK
jgi:hypothetical protein